jgi:hypothetical protein
MGDDALTVAAIPLARAESEAMTTDLVVEESIL